MTSKPLGHSDQSGFDFVQEILCGDPTYAINCDRIQWDSERKQFVIFELLLCDEAQHVTPFTSHPNRYYHKNRHKFDFLWRLTIALNASLWLINYAKRGTAHENEVLAMLVKNVDPSAELPVVTTDYRLSREQYSRWFRRINQRGAIA